MTLKEKALLFLRSFNTGVSYKINEVSTKLRDARNVFVIQDRLETRFGLSKYNSTTLGGSILSLSFFKEPDETAHTLAKVGTVLYGVAETGAHTSIKTGLTAAHKHRAVTMNGRHIVAVEDDGLFQYDGTTFTQLGQAVPTAPTLAASGAGNTLTASTYQVSLTYYSSTTGFESNRGTASSNQVVTAGQKIDITAIPSTADNATIDSVRIYLKDITADSLWLFWAEISLGITTNSITSDPTSTQVPPEANGVPVTGGAKYLTIFNRKLVYAGSEAFKNDVFFSEEDLPDAFDQDTDNRLVLQAPGNGGITGLATGFFNDSQLDPFLVIFKKRSTHVYSEIGGDARFVTLNTNIGCVSHDTIQIINGSVFFMSETGWYIVENGKLVQKDGKPFSLSDGDIDDIFTSKGFVFELNHSQSSNFFSVYYPTLRQYLTFVAEGSNQSITKTYNYQVDIGSFFPYEFSVIPTCGTQGEDSNSNAIVLIGDENGWIYSHSNQEERTDMDSSDVAVDIAAFALINWIDGEDYNATYSFRDLIVRGVNNDTDITVKAYVDFVLSDPIEHALTLDAAVSGFILDESVLDEDAFGDDRAIAEGYIDLNRNGRNLLIGFYQQETNSNMGLISAQLNYNKNGNRNRS